jgi:hypothetical protein
VVVLTTGHDKMRLTVALCACVQFSEWPGATPSRVIKMLPYVLIKNKRPIPRIIEQFKDKLVLNFHGSIWMNDASTEDFLRRVVKNSIFSSKRFLVWDAFASHKSEATKKILNELGIETAIIPGGCTKFIQVRHFV